MYRHFGKAIIRTPLFSYKDLLTQGEKAPFNFDQLIAEKLNDPVFMEALYWASPDVYQMSLDLKENRLTNKKKKDKLIHSLKKYIIRSGSRCTPYGLFAGCDLISFSSAAVAGATQHPHIPGMIRKIRFDTLVLNRLIEQIKNNASIWPHLKYRTNSSMYCTQGNYRYMEYHLKDGKRDYRLNAVAQSPVLNSIVAETATKTIGVQEILDLIGEENDEQDKLAFVDELIKMQFLVSDLEIEITGKDQLQQLKKQLTKISTGSPQLEQYLAIVNHMETVLYQFEHSPIGLLPIREINSLKAHLQQVDIEITQDILFHADLRKSSTTEIKVTDEMVSTLLKATQVLSMFCPKITAVEEELKLFKSAFTEKYGTAEIPFAEVSDMETGIGFPTSNGIGNIAYNPYSDHMTQSTAQENTFKKYKWHNFLQEKTSKLDPADSNGIILADHELQSFQDKTAQLANTISLLFSVLPNGQLILHSAGGTTANSLFARFAYLDNEMEKFAEQIALEDGGMYDKAILAEIVHLPEGRIGNVIRRSALNSYEIPFLAKTSVKNEIRLDDLMISMQDNELILRSKKLNKKIIPRLSCAHNYSTSQLSVYQLLCALQHQGITGLQFNWGMWASGRIFMPRVTYGKVILQLACWCFKPHDYLFILDTSAPEQALAAFLQHWHIPGFIALAEGDNLLFFDVQQIDYRYLLIEELKKKKPLKIVEWLHFENRQETNVPVMMNELILPLYKEVDPSKTTKAHTSYDQTDLHVPPARVFPPGSEWIYIKIYCGAHFSDQLLSEPLAQLQNTLFENELIDQLFFIRYTDPHYHIRYRMHLKQHTAAAWGDIMYIIHQSINTYIQSRAIWKMQIDTYQREVERYGSQHICLSEELFFKDSMVYLNLLKDEYFIGDEHLRLLTAIKNIDKWLTLFKFDLQERMSYTAQMSAVLLKEFGNESKTEINMQFRELKNDIYQFMQSAQFDDLFQLRHQPIFEALPRENLSSYIHMSINRWFKSDQRLMELICYTFCNKYYQMLKHN